MGDGPAQNVPLFPSGAATRPEDRVRTELATAMADMDDQGLQRALAEATAAEARLRAGYADAVLAKERAVDRQAQLAAVALARASKQAAGRAGANVQALRAEIRARREVKRAETNEPLDVPAHFVSVEDFVANFLVPVIERRLSGGRTWCPKWWKHPEAVNRLWALWRAYEHFVATGGSAMSAWWVYHVDSHLPQLMAEDGPFWQCRDGHTDGLSPLPQVGAPEGWWAVTSSGWERRVDVRDLLADARTREGRGP
jgi:hypothetical protein